MRVAAKLSQVELALRLGCSQGYINQIERTDFKVSEALLARVENAIADGTPAPAKAKKTSLKEAPTSAFPLDGLWPPHNAKKGKR